MRDFGFENAVHFGSTATFFPAVGGVNPIWLTGMKRVIETNLDYGLPVQADQAGHSAVFEGYGRLMADYLTDKDKRGHVGRKVATYYFTNRGMTGNPDLYSLRKFAPLRVLFNVFPKIPDYLHGLTPEIVSGRVIFLPNSTSDLRVRAIWMGGEAFADVDKRTGIYALAVPQNMYINLSVIDTESQTVKDYYPITRKTGKSYHIVGPLLSFGGIYAADFYPPNVALTTSEKENSSVVFDASEVAYRQLSKEDLFTILGTRNRSLNNPRRNPLSTDFVLRDLNTLHVATEPQFSINGNGAYLGALENIKQFVEAGGNLISTGQSTVFPSLLGGASSPHFYSFAGLPRPYGASTTINNTKVLSPRIVEAMGGVNQFVMQSTLPHNQHSIIETLGKSTPLAMTNYVFENITMGPWGAEWEAYMVDAFNVIEYEQGSNGGKIIYMHGELDANFNAGGLNQAFVTALIDPLLYKEDDEGDVIEVLGGEFFEGEDTSLGAMNKMNLNMVVYKGGIDLDNSEIGKDISFVFTVTDRMAPNSLAPQIDSSGDPELTLSLYQPNGQLYKTQSAISDDCTISVGVSSADNAIPGKWRYVVDQVRGVNGNRVVIMAAVDGLTDYSAETLAELINSISDDIVPDNPPSSADVTSYDIIWRGKKSVSSFNAPTMLPAAPVYPRGIVNGTFYHQLGDRRNTVSRSSVEKISFGPLVKSNDVNIWRTDDDLVLDIKGTTERVTVPGWFTDHGKVSGVAFADGSALSASDIASRAVDHEPEIDITPISIDNRITGTDGNDNLSNNGKDAKILSGKGDDTITATGGNNVFYYRMGDGNDTLVVTSGADNVNILRLHTDIASTDVTAKREGDDMKLSIGNGSVTIRGWYANAASKIDRVEFFGGTVFDDRDLERMVAGKPIVERVYYIAGPDDVNDDALKDDSAKQDPGSDSSSSGCNAGVLPLLAILGFVALTAKKRSLK